MVKVIMGIKGTGKTKHLAQLVNEAAADEREGVVCIEHGPNMMFEINYRARLVNAMEYDIHRAVFLKGFISGLVAGNYDISHIFIDSLYKIASELEVKDGDYSKVEEFLDWLEEFSGAHGVKFTLTISDRVENATDGIKKYF
ncbi:MAG: hypothetical protein IKE62_04645 [Oscillospiraceae bacterium]|nr:hypothetical protein [Oscillospiraceae bacterium]